MAHSKTKRFVAAFIAVLAAVSVLGTAFVGFF
jgi:hypothetical protein